MTWPAARRSVERRRTWTRGSLLLAAVWVLVGVLAPGAAAASATVLVARVDGPITPVVAEYLIDGVREAVAGGHQALLVELDTPGGLDTSMRDIVQMVLAAAVPVVVYVSPSGGRAASAGALITFSAHVAVMAPGTTIGAATPVNAETGETASDKVINDAAAFAESVARQRARDTDFAVATVRQGRAVTAEEAHRLGAVDLLAVDRARLLAAIHGRTITLVGGRQVTLDTAAAGAVEHDMGLLRRLLAVIADPNLAFLFLSIGTLAVIYELATPGKTGGAAAHRGGRGRRIAAGRAAGLVGPRSPAGQRPAHADRRHGHRQRHRRHGPDTAAGRVVERS